MSRDAQTTDAATEAWKAIIELVGWGANSAPRFPMVAAEFDLSPKQLAMLWRLQPAGDGLPQREIAADLYCDASYVTDMVDKLEQRELIERAADPADRRVKLLHLTDAGTTLRERALERLYEPPAGITALSAEDQRLLAGLLRRATKM